MKILKHHLTLLLMGRSALFMATAWTSTFCTAVLLLSALVCMPAYAQGTSTNLEQSFQKEFAFLETQKRNLSQRLTEFQSVTGNKINKENLRIETLAQQLLSLERESERLNEQINNAERQADINQANGEIIEATYEQASATLADFGFDLNDDVGFSTLSNDEKLARLYAVSTDAIAELSEIQRKEGDFYLTNGTETEGTIIKIGEIASYGVSDQGSGALAPAGAGALKLWDKPSADTALSLAASAHPDTLKIFLYESLNKGVEEIKEKGLLKILESGGIIGWTIVVFGILVVIMIVLRILFLRAASASTGAVGNEVGNLVSAGDIEGALAFCRKKRGSTARVVAATLRNIDRDRDHLEDIVSESILHESSSLNRFGVFIIVIAAVSPLLGLLGTVTGMIATFDVITEFGTGDPKLLSGGISTALVTTELGLIVAIPALILGNLLSGWSNRIKDDMEKAALRVMNLSQGAIEPDVETTPSSKRSFEPPHAATA